MKVYIETYGCSANRSDTEIMMGILEKMGFRFSQDPESADIIIINTCIVKTPTANKMIHRIRFLQKFGKPLIVAGCMAKAEKTLVEKISPNSSLIGPNSVEKIGEVVKATLNGVKMVVVDHFSSKPLLPHLRFNPVISIVQISSGCLSNCSYCETRLARGRLRSFSPDVILKRIRNDLIEGCKEIWLTSQDNGCYGLDIGTNLSELLYKIYSFEEKFFVRVGMMNPLWIKTFLHQLLKAYASEKIFKFFHIPVQSGSNKILSSMNRGYTVEDFIKEIEDIRKEFPQATIATDIIVGYPGETDSDFNKTLELIEIVKPDVINISKFTPRPGTEASKLPQVSLSKVKERSVKLHKIKIKLMEEKNREWIGWEGEIIVDEKSNVGRNFAYKPIVIKTNKNLFGKFVNIRVIDSKANFLTAIEK